MGDLGEEEARGVSVHAQLVEFVSLTNVQKRPHFVGVIAVRNERRPNSECGCKLTFYIWTETPEEALHGNLGWTVLIWRTSNRNDGKKNKWES